MPLPTAKLDDRRFQDIVDEAKLLIPQFCPEWTDHNVSDPGVAMIELFAWMTDMLLYRVNQVPDKMYVHFLDLIGLQLGPPRAAHAAVTFYLSAPQPGEITIPADTEVATVRTETTPAIIFTTEKDLTILPPDIRGLFTRGRSSNTAEAWVQHDMRQLGLPGQRIAIFPAQPSPGDAFYIAVDKDLSHHVLAVVVACELAGGAGIDPDHPPYEWQVWQGPQGLWASCVIEHDGTGGFNRSGEVILRVPAMVEGEFQRMQGYWLRCYLTEAQGGANAYRVSPDLERIRVEARGGTTNVRHAITVRDEYLGKSDGTPGQTVTLLNTPLLARNPNDDYLIVEIPDGTEQHWDEVVDFSESGPDDRHFTLDSQDGVLTFGPSLVQPDGSMYRFGAVPPRGSGFRFHRYQFGGGNIGNVPAHTLSVMKTSIPYVARVTNWAPALGGQDGENLEHAKIRAPQLLRSRTRAVTADDYEYLACQVPGIVRACCIAPGTLPGAPDDPKPGQVVVIALPEAPHTDGRIAPASLSLSAESRGAVVSYLNERRMLGTTLDVRQPVYLWISVQTTLHVPARSEPALIEAVQRQAEEALYRFLNPYIGGGDGKGWPFGRDLHPSEISALLQRVPFVEFVENVRIGVNDTGSDTNYQPVPARLTVPKYGLICSGTHTVTVR